MKNTRDANPRVCGRFGFILLQKAAVSAKELSQLSVYLRRVNIATHHFA